MSSHEKALFDSLVQIAPVDTAFTHTARAYQDTLTKPPGALGTLEDIACKMAVIQQSVKPQIRDPHIHVMAGDHGVVEQGVSPFPQDVTWQMVHNVAVGGAAINQIAHVAHAQISIFDVGVKKDISSMQGVTHCNIAHGTQDMSKGPAMTREQAAEAVLYGVAAVDDCVCTGSTIVGTGELGIGNTTAAAAIVSGFLDTDPHDIVGAGTGLDPGGIVHKANVVATALTINDVSSLDPLGKLAAVGGFELAAMTGTILGAARNKIAVVVDGFISTASALAACALAPNCRDYVFPSHLSAEKGHAVALDFLGLEPVLKFDMRLGEGTGAALTIPVIDAACSCMSNMATFEEAGVSGEDEADR